MSEQDQIVGLLSATCYSGRKAWDVMEDWLDICRASLQMLPQHALAVATTGKPAEDTDEIKALWARLNQRYDANDWQRFTQAYHLLLDAAAARTREWGAGVGDDTESWDIVGSIYMEMNVSSNHSGQYFTPWSVAYMMARATMGTREDVAALLADRSPLDPLTVNDPACGSGIMLLAAAACCPRWAVQRGYVMFSGQDVDATCVKMAQINTMLYGLNGWGRAWHSAAVVLQGKAGEQNGETNTRAADVQLQQLSLLGDAASGA